MPGRRLLHVKRTWLWPVVTVALVVVVVAAGAAAAIETHTVTSYWRGLWWAISLITTVGFIGELPRTGFGAALSVVLMVIGFLLLAMVSASLASLFVRDEEAPAEAREVSNEAQIIALLRAIDDRLAALESHASQASRGSGAVAGAGQDPPDGGAADPGA